MQQGILSPRKKGPPRFLLIAAVLFATLLVSSLLWVVHLTHSVPATIPVRQPAVQASPPGVYLAKPGEISRLDVQTHKVIWRTSIPAKIAAMSKYAGRPVVIGNTVYLIRGNANNTVLAFDANQGKFRWSSVFADAVDISVVDGVLYVAPTGAVSGKLYAVDPANGKIKATYTSPLGMWNPTVVNGVAYYASGSSINAQRLADKKLLWHQQIQAGQALELVSVKNGIVYTSAMVTVPAKGKSTVGLLYAFDAKAGKQLWKSSTVPLAVSDFTVTNDVVYCLSAGGDLDAFDSHTGKHVWHLHSNTYDLLVNAGVLYINYNTNTASGSGGIEALHAKNGKKLWQISLTGIGTHHLIGLQRGIIYTMADDGKIGSMDAFNANSGAQVWDLPINGDAAAAVA